MCKILFLNSLFAFLALCGCKEKLQQPEEEPSEIVADTDPGPIIFVSDQGRDDHGYDIFTMNEDGSNAMRLTTSLFSYSSPKWSPDGSKIVFKSTKNRTSETSPIYVLDLTTRIITQIAEHGQGATWSPDGKRIAYTKDPRCGGLCPDRDVFILDLETGEEENISGNLPTNEGVSSWVQEDVLLITSADTTDNPEGDSELYFVNFKTGSRIRLTDNEVRDGGAKVSPNDSLIVYSSFTGTDWDLFIMNADGSNKRNLTNDERFFNNWAAWSPDGSAIIFQASNEAETGSRDIQNLFIINVDGTGLTQLTDGPYTFREPDWRWN